MGTQHRKIGDAFADYEGYDLDYERMFDRAYDAYDALLDKGAKTVGWRDVANEMGIQLNTLNGDDYELLKSAIEDALIQWDYDNTELNSMYPMYEGMQQYNLPRKGSGNYYSGPVRLSPLSRETVYVNGFPKKQDSRASRSISFKRVKDDADDIQVGDKVKTDHDDRTHEVVDTRSKQGRTEYLLGDTSGWWSAWQLTKVSDSKISDSTSAAERAVNELYEYRYEIGGVAKLLSPRAQREGRGSISIQTNEDAVRNKAHVRVSKVETDPDAKQRLEEFYSEYAMVKLKIVGARCNYNGSYSESIADPTPNRSWGESNSYDMSSSYAPSEWVINLDVVEDNISDSKKIKDAAINVDEFCNECVRLGNEHGFESSKEWITNDCCLLNYEFRLDEDNNDPNTPDWFTHLIQLKLHLVKYGRGRGVGYYVDLNGFIDFIDRRLEHFASNPKAQKFVPVFTPLADELKKLAQGVIDGSKVFDSKRIKDDDSTDNVIDGILIITFNDDSKEDGLKAVQEHANEQGDDYETYEVKESDGKVGVDMCAKTTDPNAFVKELLTSWGVIDAVADVDFKKSDLMKEAEQGEVSDSKVADASSLKMPKKWDRYTASINGVDYTVSHEPTGFGSQQKRNGTFMLSSSDGYFQDDRFNYGDTYGGYISPRDAFQTLRGRIGERPLSDSRKIKDSTYGTSFTLTHPVNDYNAALDYLQADDMTQYLNNDLNYLGLQHLEGKIKEIRWVLEDEQNGYIVLYTTEPLAQKDLDKISEWISGQCSDGLGEGFEQQDFASGEDFEEYEYEDEDGETQTDYEEVNTMASFDWETNDYKLKLYDSARIKDGCGKDADSVGKVNSTDIFRDNKKGGVYVWVKGKKKTFPSKDKAEAFIKSNYNEDGSEKK